MLKQRIYKVNALLETALTNNFALLLAEMKSVFNGGSCGYSAVIFGCGSAMLEQTQRCSCLKVMSFIQLAKKSRLKYANVGMF